MHPDHIGGLSDGENRLFPNAVLHADVHELPQWQREAEKANAAAKRIVGKIEPYITAKKFQSFEGNTVFFPGFSALASHGHTEGHSFYALESKGKKIKFWGDFVVNDKVQFEKTDVNPPGEKDIPAGINLRKKIYAEAANEGYLIGGAHFSFPGLGRVRAVGDKYIWVPVDYAQAKPDNEKR
jgi:glyoxylase-like metal-dependent hydrolase (beta-lactamase superfamily II)